MNKSDAPSALGRSPARDENARASLRGRHIDSVALFRGHGEIVILHDGQEYRLRITKANKLILTK